MPATFQPFGFSLYSYEGGKTSYTSRTFPLSVEGMAQNLGFGDCVSFAGGTTSISGVQNMENATNATTVLTNSGAWTIGVVESFSYVTPQGQNVNTNYWAANTPTMNSAAPIVTINHLPNSIFRVQCNAAFNAVGAYGVNVNVVNNGATGAFTAPDGTTTGSTVSQPNPATGQSTQWLCNALTGAIAGPNNSAGQCKIIGLAPTSTAFPVNNWTDLFPIVLVRFNMHFLGAPTPSTN